MEPYDYKNVLIDEIALDGLDGISLDLLWKRVEKTIRSPVTAKMKARFWKFLVTRKCITFYQNPEPHVTREVVDRFSFVDKVTGYLQDPDDYIEQYTYAPIENEYGSSVHFHTRKVIEREELLNKEYFEIESEYGATMVMAASIEERWNALAGHLPISVMPMLTPAHYCCLEIIGKSRENGDMSVGKSNMLKILKDPKFIFYSKKYLKEMNLIKEQVNTQKTSNKSIRAKMLRLNRFYKPTVLSLPKSGLVRHIVDHLLTMPDYTDSAERIFAKYPNDKPSKKKKYRGYTMLKFCKQQVSTEDKQGNKKTSNKLFLTLNCVSDESSDSDEDNLDTTKTIQCQYKVGMNILRQAYERIIDAGAKGLSQTEIAAVLGIGIYTSRIICRLLRKRKFVREFIDDKGRQRTTKLIAICGGINKNFLEEQKKFDQYVKENARKRKAASADNNTDEVPEKKMKLNDVEYEPESITTTLNNVASVITEIKKVADIQKVKKNIESKKPLSLRKLKFMNGLLKILEERKVVSGFRPMATIVARETSEPELDAKVVKSILQKLILEGHIKMYKIKFPSKSLHVILTCAPNIKPTDQIIKNKLKDMSFRAMLQNVHAKKKPPTKFKQYTYPRYMKMRKLHEILLRIVYFENKVTNNFGKGFACVMDILQNSTVEFALGNTSNVADVDNLKITDDVLDKKLHEVPEALSQSIIQSKSLQNTLKYNLKYLAYLGLIQLIEKKEEPINYAETNGMNSNLLFYVNKNASIINTSGHWPIDSPSIQELEKQFVFNTIEDCEYYWDAVYGISINTTITLTRRYQKASIRPPIRQACEVQLRDNGERFGNGLGPCGFDSCFYMDIPHLWRTYLTRVKKVKKPLSKPKTTTKIASKAKGLSIDIKKKPKQKIKRKPKQVVVPKPKHVETHPKKRERKQKSDEWTETENGVLVACKVAMAIMCPFPIAGCTIILNSVARDILTSFDRKKSYGSQCHKRIQKLFINSTILHNYECLLNEMKRRHHLTKNYENLLKKLKLLHTSDLKKIVKEARLPMMELVMATMKVAKSSTFKPNIPCVAMNYDDFCNKYSVIPMSQGRSVNTYRTPYDRDATMGAIKEGIIQVIMFTSNHLLTLDVAKKIQDAFKTESDSNLRIAIEELRQSGAMKARNKVIHNYLLFAPIKVQDTIDSSFKISVKYKREWDCRLNSDFVDGVAESLVNKIPVTDVKGSAEVNCVFAELQAIDALEFWPMVTPSVTGNTGSMLQEEQLNIIDIEQKVKLKSGAFSWSAKNDYNVFADLYRDIDIEGNIEAMLSCRVIELGDIERAQAKNATSNDKIIVYLREKGEVGANLTELQENCIPNKETLVSKLKEMESEKIIKRVGFFHNRIVLYELTKTWAINLTDKYMIPAPWYTLDAYLKKDIFNQWTSTVVNKIFENPGCPLSFLVDKLKLISARNVQDICIFLEKCNCVTLEVFSYGTPGLFNDEDTPVFREYNDYEASENILVSPVANIITRFAYIKRYIAENL